MSVLIENKVPTSIFTKSLVKGFVLTQRTECKSPRTIEYEEISKMKQIFKDTIIVAIVIIFFIVSLAGIFELVSSLRHDEPEVLYGFAISAKSFHGKIEDANLLQNIGVLLEAIPGELIDDTSEIENMIRQGMLTAREYRDSYSWLEPTDDTLQIYDSLLKENILIVNCYSRLNLAWSAKQSGDDISCERYCDETRELYDEVKHLRSQNTTDLDSLQLQAELELNK